MSAAREEGRGELIEKQPETPPLPPETEAAYDFVEKLKDYPDTLFDASGAPYWHGWGIRAAFEAGAEWDCKRQSRLRGE